MDLFGERFYFDMLHDGDIDSIFLKMHQVLASTGRHLSVFVNETVPLALSNEVFATFQMVSATVPRDSDVWARVEENIIRILRRLSTFSELSDKNVLHAMLTTWMCAIELVASSGGESRNILEQISVRFMQELTTLTDETATGPRLSCRCQEHAWIQLVRISSSRYWVRLNRALKNEPDAGGVFSGFSSIKVPTSAAVMYAVELYADYPEVFERGKTSMLPGTQLDDRPLLQVCAKLLSLLHHRKDELRTIDGTEGLLLKLWEHIAPKLSDRKELGNDLTLPVSVSDYAERIEAYARLDSISTEHDTLWIAFSKLSLFCCQEASVWELLQRQLFEQWTSLKAKRWNHTEAERVLAYHLVHAISTDLTFISGRIVSIFAPVLEADSCSDPRIQESILNSFIFLLKLSWQRNHQPAALEQCVRKGNSASLLKFASDAKFPVTRASIGMFVWVFKSLASRKSPANIELIRRLESTVPRIKDEYLGAIFEQLEATASVPQPLWKRAVTLWAARRTSSSGSALKFVVKQRKAKLDSLLEEFASNFKQSKATQPLVELVNHCTHVDVSSDVVAPLWLMVMFLSADDQMEPDVPEVVHKLLLSSFQDMDPFIEECNGGLVHDSIFFWALESMSCIESGMDPTATQQVHESIKDWFSRRLTEVAQTQLARDDVSTK
ncbi:hypothetical protein AAVH_03944 [Aphelenchoides avenae]|nr:hypothetical protein AAVH_03944 [Aphelenchus avenae]